MMPENDNGLDEAVGPSAGNRTLRARFHAWALAKSHRTMHKLYGDRKQAMFGDLRGTVLEVGPGRIHDRSSSC